MYLAHIQLLSVVLLLTMAITLTSAAPMERRDSSTGQRNSTASSGSPSVQQIQALRHHRSNYRNLLFAYSEMLDMLQHSVGARGKRSDEDGRPCHDIAAQLTSKGVPTNTSCPYTYTCDYSHSRYPHFIISTQCSTNYTTDGTNQLCEGYGHTWLSVLTREENGVTGGWSLQENAESVFHGCQVSTIGHPSS